MVFALSLFKEEPTLTSFICLLIIMSVCARQYTVCITSCIILLFLIYFYRHPYINPSISECERYEIRSPAYGTIKKIINEDDGYLSIIISLKLNDIHVQYYPVSGFVVNQMYDRTGKFSIAFDLDKSSYNEKIITSIKSNHVPYGDIIVKQIAGILTRRISTLDRTGTEVKVGNKLGMIKFGSRVDLVIPSTNFILKVKPGDYVKGPYTIIGHYSH